MQAPDEKAVAEAAQKPRRPRFRNYVPSGTDDAALQKPEASQDGARGSIKESRGGPAEEPDKPAQLAAWSQAIVRDLEGKARDDVARGVMASSASSGYSSSKAKTSNSADVNSIAPRKVNWDLKRDAKKDLAKLARKTQRAITDLAEQERLRRQREEQDNDDEDSSGSGSDSSSDDDDSSDGDDDSNEEGSDGDDEAQDKEQNEAKGE